MIRSLLILIITITGCNTINKTNEQIQLKTSYRVEWIGERPLMDYSYLNIILDQNNKAFGLAGCNYWSANYQINDNQLTFTSSFSVTKKVCAPALMEQEQRFLKTLATVQSWDFPDIKQLRLWTTDKQTIRLWPEAKK